jgi:hypothetical protein
MITKYRIFENIQQEKNIFNHILTLPLHVRIDIKKLLLNINDQQVKESFFSDIRFRLKDWLHEKMLLWLLNQSEKRINKMLETLTIFDPTDFSNIKKCDVIYLGGGIDKTPDEYVVNPVKGKHPMIDVGSRLGLLKNICDKIQSKIPKNFKGMEVDRFVFIVDRGTNIENILNDYELSHIELIAGGGSWRFEVEKKIGIQHVVPNEDLLVIERTGVINLNKYTKPLIINPLRKEQSVRDDDEFKKIYIEWKRGSLDKEYSDKKIKHMSRIINRDIKQPDLRLLNVCDTNLVKYDSTAGDGTKGELQFGALKHYMNIFLWLDGGYKVKDVSLWTFPEITKMVRNEEELDLLIESIKNFNKNTYGNNK